MISHLVVPNPRGPQQELPPAFGTPATLPKFARQTRTIGKQPKLDAYALPSAMLMDRQPSIPLFHTDGQMEPSVTLQPQGRMHY